MLKSNEINDLVTKLTEPSMLQVDGEAGRSLWSDARRRFIRNKAAVFSLVLLTFIALACVVGPWVLPHAFDSADWDAMSSPPSLKNSHFWGTDEAGRDLLVRCLVGGRVSLTVGLLNVAASPSSSASALPASSATSAMTTLAPSRTKWRAMAAP